jgi:hypothetical protein
MRVILIDGPHSLRVQVVPDHITDIRVPFYVRRPQNFLPNSTFNVNEPVVHELSYVRSAEVFDGLRAYYLSQASREIWDRYKDKFEQAKLREMHVNA